MTAEVLSTLILEVINNGHIRSGSEKLEYEDILQFVYIAKGKVLYDIFKAEMAETGQSPTINSLLRLYTLTVSLNKNKKKIVTLPADVIVLPEDSGLYSITPIIDGEVKYCMPMVSSVPGSEWVICRDDSGIMYFISYGKEIILFNISDSIKEVEVSAILNEEDSEIPDNAAYDVAKGVLQQILRTIAIPIDKTADGNPNIDDALKTRISAATLNA